MDQRETYTLFSAIISRQAESDLYSEDEGPDIVLLEDMGILSETSSETKEPG